MTTDSMGLLKGTRSIAGLAVLLAVALLLLSAPSHANAAGGSSVLRQGLGMKAKPSVRVGALQRALERRGYGLGARDGRFGREVARRGPGVDVVAHVSRPYAMAARPDLDSRSISPTTISECARTAAIDGLQSSSAPWR